MKSLPLKLMGTECSIVLWFFVSLEMVLNGTLGCFYYYQSMKNSKPISPQKVLVYSLEDYPSMPGGIPQVWWSTIFFLFSCGLFKCTSLISVLWGQSFQFSYSLF